ncbi:hypothetical protein ACTID9_19915 [Brevibacillus fluminis]|uniref:hypothetical protein n=1 Tax=Brevibacillus fluminis TaxID=511487 RepID=UPI003F8BF0E1
MSSSVIMEEKIKKMEDDLKRLRKEFEKSVSGAGGFELQDTDVYLTEVYNA